MANLIVAQLLFLESENADKDIHLYINSPGGIVTRRACRFTTRCSSSTATSRRFASGRRRAWARLLLAGGTKGKRFAHCRTRASWFTSPVPVTRVRRPTSASTPKETLELKRAPQRDYGETHGPAGIDVDRGVTSNATTSRAPRRTSKDYGIIDHGPRSSARKWAASRTTSSNADRCNIKRSL